MNLIDINKENNNTYRFRLKSKSGGILLNSVNFKNKKEIQKTFSDLNPETSNSIFERKTDNNGMFHFSLKNTNGILIGNSQLYSSEAGMENGIKNLKISLATLQKI